MLLLSALVVCAALWTARESGQQTDLRMRRELAQQARSIVETIDPDNVRALSFTAEDVNCPEFQRMCFQLRTYAEETGLRSLYTMALRDGNLVFGPESLRTDSPYASLPGTVYRTPTRKILEIFQTGEATVQGPASDEYGNFVTASVPVIDPHTGKVLMIVGLDQETSVWRAEIRKAQWAPFLTAMIPLGLLIIGYFILKIRQRLAYTYRLRHTEAVTCATIMLLLTLTSAKLIHVAEEKSRETDFYAQAQARAGTYIQTFKTLRSSLQMLSRFFESGNCINLKEFHNYCEPLIENNPIQACFWLPEVPADETENFIKKIRAAGRPDFSIWQLPPQNLPEPVQAAVHYPALYIEPLSVHKAALGYDLYSAPLRRTAIIEAMRSGKATATDPVDIIAPSNEPPALLIFRPVSAKTMSGITGFAILPDMLLTSQLHNPSGEIPGLSVTLFQLRAGESPYWLACSQKNCNETCWATLRSGLHATIPVFAFGKVYSLLIAPEPQWFEAHPLHQGSTTLVVGLILTLLMTTLIATLANRPALLEKRVQQRTEELQESRARLRTLIETIPDLIWMKDMNGVYLSCNTAFERLFGAKEADIIGKTDYDFVDKELADFFRENDRQAAKLDRPRKNEEALTFAEDGYSGIFETVKTPVRDEENHLIGVLGIARDITARKKDEQQITSQLEELNRWYKVTIGRETRVMELKKEINDILSRTGQPPRYHETLDASSSESITGDT